MERLVFMWTAFVGRCLGPSSRTRMCLQHIISSLLFHPYHYLRFGYYFLLFFSFFFFVFVLFAFLLRFILGSSHRSVALTRLDSLARWLVNMFTPSASQGCGVYVYLSSGHGALTRICLLTHRSTRSWIYTNVYMLRVNAFLTRYNRFNLLAFFSTVSTTRQILGMKNLILLNLIPPILLI